METQRFAVVNRTRSHHRPSHRADSHTPVDRSNRSGDGDSVAAPVAPIVLRCTVGALSWISLSYGASYSGNDCCANLLERSIFMWSR